MNGSSLLAVGVQSMHTAMPTHVSQATDVGQKMVPTANDLLSACGIQNYLLDAYLGEMVTYRSTYDRGMGNGMLRRMLLFRRDFSEKFGNICRVLQIIMFSGSV